MKSLFVIAATLFLSISLSAQTTSQSKTTPMYVCTKAGCPLCSHAEGICTHHKTALVMEGKYYCPMHPEATTDTTSTCPKCKIATVKMEEKKKKKVMKK
jgi:hypothetical protein